MRSVIERSLLLLILLVSVNLIGCAGQSSAVRWIEVNVPPDINVAVYVDSQFVGMTPVRYKVNPDTLDGATLRLVNNGNTLRTYTLKKDSVYDDTFEQQKTALALGGVAAGVGMVFIPYPFALFSPLLVFIPTTIVGEVGFSGRWNYTLTRDSLPEIYRNRKKAENDIKELLEGSERKTQNEMLPASSALQGELHQIKRRWFLVRQGVKTPSQRHHYYGYASLVNSTGICYDKKNKAVWLENENVKSQTYVLPVDSVYFCAEVDSSSRSILTIGIEGGLLVGLITGLASDNNIAALVGAGVGAALTSLLAYIVQPNEPVVDEGSCPQPFPSREDVEKWFERYPCSGTAIESTVRTDTLQIQNLGTNVPLAESR